jgi:hypothetical protein
MAAARAAQRLKGGAATLTFLDQPVGRGTRLSHLFPSTLDARRTHSAARDALHREEDCWRRAPDGPPCLRARVLVGKALIWPPAVQRVGLLARRDDRGDSTFPYQLRADGVRIFGAVRARRNSSRGVAFF